MSGTREGGRKARDTNLRNNPNHYKEIGQVGGTRSRGYAFAHGRVDPSAAGVMGGRVSGRGRSKKTYNEGTQWVNNRKANSTSSRSTTKQLKPRVVTDCRACFQDRVVHYDGFCHTCYTDKRLRAVVRATERMDGAWLHAEYVNYKMAKAQRLEEAQKHLVLEPTDTGLELRPRSWFRKYFG